MVKIKPFSSIYYYNKFSKANNISRFVRSASVFGDENFKREVSNDLTTGSLAGFDFCDEKVDLNEVFKHWLEGGILTVAGGHAFYVCEISYQIAGKSYCCRGVFAVMNLPDRSECEVLSFEASSVSGRSMIIDAMQRSHFQFTPVFALYDDVDSAVKSVLDGSCNGPCFEKAKYLGVSYKVWEVSDSEIVDRLIDGFSKVSRIYLAGGAEVFDAAVVNGQRNKNLNSVLTFFVDRSSTAIAVLPVHRVVSMSMFDLGSSLKKLSSDFDYFDCKNLNSMRNKMFGLKREGKRSFGVYSEERFGVLVLKNLPEIEKFFEGSGAVGELDAFVVDELILKKLLGVKTSQVQFTGSAKVAKFAVDEGDGSVAIFLNSECMSKLLDVALEEGGRRVQKVANIFPRPVDGLVFYSAEG